MVSETIHIPILFELDFSFTCDLNFCRLSWPEVMGSGKTGAGPYTLAYFFYVLWALIFASLAACLVRMFAPYGNEQQSSLTDCKVLSMSISLHSFQRVALVYRKLKPFSVVSSFVATSGNGHF